MNRTGFYNIINDIIESIRQGNWLDIAGGILLFISGLIALLMITRILMEVAKMFIEFLEGK